MNRESVGVEIIFEHTAHVVAVIAEPAPVGGNVYTVVLLIIENISGIALGAKMAAAVLRIIAGHCNGFKGIALIVHDDQGLVAVVQKDPVLIHNVHTPVIAQIANDMEIEGFKIEGDELLAAAGSGMVIEVHYGDAFIGLGIECDVPCAHGIAGTRTCIIDDGLIKGLGINGHDAAHIEVSGLAGYSINRTVVIDCSRLILIFAAE